MNAKNLDITRVLPFKLTSSTNEEVIMKKKKRGEKRHMCYKILHLIPDGEMHVKLLLNACCMKQLFQLNKPSQNLTCA